MMENDGDGDDTNLKEEIEAELDKISISSLEKDDVDSDSKSDIQSDDSDTDLDELPESVLHCINIIKNKSKTAEELILQDLEDIDVLSYSYGVVPNHMHLRIELPTEHKEHPEQLIKMLSEIEKEEFLRNKIHCGGPDSIPEPDLHDLPVDKHVLPDDADINFGYCEVEERCRQSFEAWQEKQKELEDQEKETLKAQRDREKKQFQEEEEKRHCWMKQFEVEKKKLENIQKQEQDKMNDELHKEEKMWKEKFKKHEEFIKSLHLQMEEERTRFKDLQEKEKMHLLKRQHNAAVTIQAKYKAFVAYQKYNPIIKEQLESKKKKAQEWKEKEAKIRQMEEEKLKRLEEEQKVEEERKKQKQEERRKREKEYEEKKTIIRREKEQLLNKERLRLREDAHKQLIICRALKKDEYNIKNLTVEDTSKNKDDIAKKVGDEKSKKWEDVPLWLLEKSNRTENVDRQLVLKESIQAQSKDPIIDQAILAEFKVKNEDLAKQQCSEKIVKEEGKCENTDKKTELEKPGLKENVKEQFQMQELKLQIQNGEHMKTAINENMRQDTQIILGHNEKINKVKNNEAWKIIQDNQQNKIQKVEKEELTEQNGTLYEENNISVGSMKQQALKLENSEVIGENITIKEKKIDLKSKETKEVPKDNTLNSDVIFNSNDSMVTIEGKINEQDYIFGRNGLCEDLGSYNAKSSLIFKEINSLKSQLKEIPEECHENRAECESTVTCSLSKPTLLSSIEEKRLAWIKSHKPWFEIFKQNQQKKFVQRKRPVKCPASMMPPLNTLEILRCGPWKTLQQVTTVTFQDLPGCSLSTLAECPNLQFLSLRRCGLISLHSLSNCKKLKHIDAQENHIETINCENLDNLCVVLLNKNQLTSFHGLDGCTNIQNLELSHNKITRIDLTSAIRWFDACYSLHELSITGNPLLQEINWRDFLLKVLPALRILNGEMLNSYSERHTEEHYEPELGCFVILCQSQIQEFNSLVESYINGKGNFVTLDAAENLCHYFNKLMTLSNECRYSHEHGNISVTQREDSETQQNHLTPTNSDSILQNRVLHSCADKYKLDSPDTSEKWMNSGSSHSTFTNSLCEDTEGRNQEEIVYQKREDSKSNSISMERIPFMETVMTSSLLWNCQNTEHRKKIMAAMVIQAYWRGYIERRRIHFSTKLQPPAIEPLMSKPNYCIKNKTILKKEKRENTVNIQEQREKAAILIQAVWKGFLLRKKLTTALEAIKNEESEEEYEEINLEDFTFDEAALEEEWLTLDSTRFSAQTLLVPNQLHWPKFSGTLKYDDTSLNLRSHPAQAWLCNEKEDLFSSEHAQFNSRSQNRTLSWTPESKTSRKSLLKTEKEEKISKEWGFKDIATAQQMLKRAQKMKSKKLRKKLDPMVCLALLRNNENKVSVTKSPKMAQPRRDGYFEGKKEELIYKDATPNEKLERSKEYTYQWLHTQVGIHETTNSRNMKCNHFLPELDPDVLNGGRVQLVARLVSREDTDLDLFSMTSGSALSVKREKKNQAHRHSAGSSSLSVKGIFAPVITNTRPSKKERISFRDYPVQLSGGWGSGKKKAKTSN
ncbi:leucine-rich repeat and IQ domain-containing protein 1 isoform X4 [Mustela erminea]|uniref:leucine-rich repeat and IQ domain-containing protein 1 isoform X4 n=1 Tax=Mustela erminea TaxID=36723 RepID=UPI0013868964|nr:leucine-rich repeat and IQ domain-containing protein 1 isoform X4 [Mustela erminea]